MSKEITFILEPDNGKMTAEVSGISPEMLTDLRGVLHTGQNVNCGKPLEEDLAEPLNHMNFVLGDNQSIWLHRIYHNSVVDGPGRRSVVQVAGCSIRCLGCYVPQTHKREKGALVSISSIFSEIVRNRVNHDGVTILGGEPFDQPGPVAEFVSRLKRHELHITIYSGYTLEALIERKDPNVDFILTHTDLLIDGPFLSQLGQDAGEYRGSRNQRMIIPPISIYGL